MVASSIIVDNLVKVLPNPSSLTIKPRLEYCVYLVGRILKRMSMEYDGVQKSNGEEYCMMSDFNSKSEFKKQVLLEANLACATEALVLVKDKLESVSQISDVTQVLPLISVIRTVNSNIYSVLPDESGNLVELSGILGSIAMDSGSLVEAKFDFRQTNLESQHILAEVNLIVDSKINKQYPNLNF